MKKSVLVPVMLGLLGFGWDRTAAQVARPYRDLTGGRELTILMSQELVPGGSIGHSVQSDGDLHDVHLDNDDATTFYRVRSPSRGIDYTVIRKDNVLSITGTLGGGSVSKTIKINDRPWYQAIETSLHDYIVTYAATGVARPLTFWIVQPWEAKAYLLQAKTELQEQISVNGRQVTGVRVRVTPTGILRLLWSSIYWYRPSDAGFVRNEVVRGGPGTPKSVVEFMGKF